MYVHGIDEIMNNFDDDDNNNSWGHFPRRFPALSALAWGESRNSTVVIPTMAGIF